MNRPGAGVKTCGLHLAQGLTGKGAGPAVRLTSDGHYPREQELTRSAITSSPALRVPGPPRARARQHPSRRQPGTSPAAAPPAGGKQATGRLSSGPTAARPSRLPARSCIIRDRAPRVPARAGCQLGRERIRSGAGPADSPRSVRYPRDRRSRATLAIRHTVTAQLNAHGQRPAPLAPDPHGTLCCRRSAPGEPAPLLADVDGSGDTGRRSSTPASSPTRHPWPMASGHCPTPAR
jgi:hypothetical protein